MANDNALNGVALIVRDPFDAYRRGDRIVDQDVIDQLLNSQHVHNVEKIRVESTLIDPIEISQAIAVDTPNDTKKRGK